VTQQGYGCRRALWQKYDVKTLGRNDRRIPKWRHWLWISRKVAFTCPLVGGNLVNGHCKAACEISWI